MKNKQGKFVAALFLFALLCWTAAEGTGKMSKGKVLYRVGLVKDQAKSVAVKQNGKVLELSLEGFEKPFVFEVNGGGVRTCRTTLEHKSDDATVILSLPIANPNTPCQMTAGYVSINSEKHQLSLSQETIKKTAGSDSQLRKLVEKYFGKI